MKSKIFKIAIVLLLCSFNYTYAALTTNLVAGYKLSDVTDVLGGTSLTNTGSVTFVSGLIGNAANFAVPNSTQNLYRTPPLAYTDYTNFTINTWLYVASSTSLQIPIRHVVNNGSLERGIYLEQLSTNKWEWAMFDGVSHITDSVTSVASGTWMMVSVTYDNSVQRMYINGIEESSSSYAISGYSRNTLSNFSLGAYQDTAGGAASNFYNGKMDETYLWNRVLSKAEITQLYNGGAGLQYPFTTTSVPNNLGFFNFFGY